MTCTIVIAKDCMVTLCYFWKGTAFAANISCHSGLGNVQSRSVVVTCALSFSLGRIVNCQVLSNIGLPL